MRPSSTTISAATPGKTMSPVPPRPSSRCPWTIPDAFSATTLSARAPWSLPALPAEITRRLGRYEVPVYRLGRLAVSLSVQGRGLGAELLLSAGARALAVAGEVGGVALAIDAKDERTAAWYEGFGAMRLLDDALKLVLPLATIAETHWRAFAEGSEEDPACTCFPFSSTHTPWRSGSSCPTRGLSHPPCGHAAVTGGWDLHDRSAARRRRDAPRLRLRAAAVLTPRGGLVEPAHGIGSRDWRGYGG